MRGSSFQIVSSEIHNKQIAELTARNGKLTLETYMNDVKPVNYEENGLDYQETSKLFVFFGIFTCSDFYAMNTSIQFSIA